MSSRKLPDESREVTLRRWCVMEVVTKQGTRSRHVCGHDVTYNFGRTSSAIQEFCLDSMTVTTRSGRIYRLVGMPGNSRVGQTAWDNWCSSNGIASHADVTDQYLNIDKFSTIGFERITRSVLREEDS